MQPIALQIIDECKKAYGELTERVVEVPFLFKHIRKVKTLDVGSLESSLAFYLHREGYDVTAVDIRQPHTTVKLPPQFYVCDVRKMPFPDEMFEQVICISTLEHIGLRAYGLENLQNYLFDANGDFRALEEMRRVTRVSGNMIITVPYGKVAGEGFYWQRVYTKERIQKLLELECMAYTNLDTEFFMLHEPTKEWIDVTEDRASKTVSSGIVKAICCLSIEGVF